MPGLRAGFILGDENVISLYKLLVSNGASPVPIPIQNIALLYMKTKNIIMKRVYIMIKILKLLKNFKEIIQI